jgi:hypothetical protein
VCPIVAFRLRAANDNFLDGTQEDYWSMYAHAAWGLKNASSRLRVGGPATNSPTEWLSDFLNFTASVGVPFDFISSHNYAGCGQDTGDARKVVGGVAAARSLIGDDVEYLVTEYGAACTQGIGQAGDAPGSRYHDTAAQASFVAAVVAGTSRLQSRPPDALSYWALSDVFEEDFFPVANCSAHGGFGLVALGCGGNSAVLGIPKPTYRVYQLLAQGGSRLAAVAQPPPPSQANCSSRTGFDILHATPLQTQTVADQGTCCLACALHPGCKYWSFALDASGPLKGVCWLKSDQGTGFTPNKDRTSGAAPTYIPSEWCSSTAGVLATVNASGSTQLLLFNHAPDGDAQITECNLTVVVSGSATTEPKPSARLRRIDDAHASYVAAYDAMGRPDYTTPVQDAALLSASELVDETLAISVAPGVATISLVLPPHSVAEVTVEWA